MKSSMLVLALSLAVLAPAATVAQSTPAAPAILETRAEYLSGQPGVKKGGDPGALVLDAETLSYWNWHVSFLHKRLVEKFRIPLDTIVNASNTVDTNGPNPSMVAAFGVMALGSKRHDEYVSVTTETETTTDVVIFKVEKNTSAAWAAKITFAAKKARAATVAP